MGRAYPPGLRLHRGKKDPTHFAPGLVIRSVMVGVLEEKKTGPLINLFG
jgi:hypothetical protein